jgi:RNA polymerase sigma factor (sigma-70 family)
VYVVACNEARRGWRHEQRSPKWSARERPIVDDPAGRVATVLDLHVALNQLGARQRAAVVLRYFADLPLAEIAAVMGCATGTVKATLHQALDRLRIELEVSDHAD